MDTIHDRVLEALSRPGSRLAVVTTVDPSRNRPPASIRVQRNCINGLGILDSPVIGYETEAAYVVSLDMVNTVGVYWLVEIAPAQLSFL